MRKFVLGLTILLFAISLNAGGKLLFDLTAQHFSKTLKNSKNYGKEGRYELSNAYVSTNTRFGSNGYERGIFSVRLKTLPKNWRVNITIYHNYGVQQDLIKVSSSSGDVFVISLKDFKITINNKVFKIKQRLSGKFIEVGISSINEVVKIKINGQEFYKTKTSTTDRLQIVEVSSILSRLEIFSVD